MAARSLASLTISFGLVSIPVKLFSATQATAAISFNLIHGKCGSRLRQQYICIKEGVVVEREEMVKGYEFAKEQYVTFTSEELKALEEESTGTVDITEFVPDEKIDGIWYDKAYFLGPDKGGAKPYALLSEGMRSTGRCALARWAARGKQYLVQIRPVKDGLIMQQLLYADEVRSIKDIDIQEATVKEAELKLAVQLIEQISEDEFNPKQYEDDVKKRIEAAVEKKISGKEISVSPEAPAAKGGAQVIDLMGALRASLTKGAPKKTEPQRKPPKRAAAVAAPIKKAGRRQA